MNRFDQELADTREDLRLRRESRALRAGRVAPAPAPAPAPRSRRPRECPYCGRIAVRHSQACHAHRDLPALDAHGEILRLEAYERAQVKRAIEDQYR